MDHQIWDISEGRQLFYGSDPDDQDYSTRAHLAEVIGLLGPPPLDLLKRGRRSREFFAEDGKIDACSIISIVFFELHADSCCGAGNWIADVQIPSGVSLEGCETSLEGESKEGFLNLMRGMLQWRPEDKKTAKQLVQDPWINS